MDERRKFMATVGVMMASAATLGCSPLRRLFTSCYVIPPSTRTATTPTPFVACYVIPLSTEAVATPAPTPAITCYTVVPGTPVPTGQIVWTEAWQNLAAPWYSLDALAKAAGDDKKGPEMLDRLIAEHQKAVQVLVNTGEIDAEVGADLQAAFEGAAYHVWRRNSNLTCYAAVQPPDYEFASRTGLTEQAKVLAEMSERSSIDEATVAKAEAAIERDITFLAMSTEDRQQLLETVRAAAGTSGQYPELSDVDMEVPESAVKAAHLLIQVLSHPSGGQ
jgi:hypothetical protein